MSNRCTALALSLILAAACLPLAAQTYNLQAFSIPYAPHSDTYATGINNRGAVVGYFLPPKRFYLGFKRNADGVFEPPIDDPNGLSTMSRQTYALGINDSGVIVGYYANPNNHGYTGFVRDNGVFTDFLVPANDSTYILGINNKGDFVGLTVEFGAVNVVHGFVDNGGIVSQFDVPGASATYANGIAADGTIVGYFDKNSTYFGFIRGPAGQYKPFAIPGARLTQAYGINNAAHKIVGSYYKYPLTHGFVYDYITGVITTVDWPDPHTKYTLITGINSHGVIVGQTRVAGQNIVFSFIGTPQ